MVWAGWKRKFWVACLWWKTKQTFFVWCLIWVILTSSDMPLVKIYIYIYGSGASWHAVVPVGSHPTYRNLLSTNFQHILHFLFTYHHVWWTRGEFVHKKSPKMLPVKHPCGITDIVYSLRSRLRQNLKEAPCTPHYSLFPNITSPSYCSPPYTHSISLSNATLQLALVQL